MLSGMKSAYLGHFIIFPPPTTYLDMLDSMAVWT